MKKIYIILIGIILTCFSACGSQEKFVKLPVTEYPLNKEIVERAIEKCKFPGNLAIEENDCLQVDNTKSSLFSITHPTRDIYGGHCMGILSYQSENFTSLGLTISSIDQE